MAVLFFVLVFVYFKSLKHYRPPYLFVFLSALLMMCYGILIVSKEKPNNRSSYFLNHWRKGSILRLQVIDELKHSAYYLKYEAVAIRVDQRNTSGKILIRLRKDGINGPLIHGEEISTAKEPEIFTEAMNPGAFDFKEYERRKGVFHQLTLNENEFVRSRPQRNTMKVRALLFRDNLLKPLLHKGFSKEAFSVMEALLLGKRQDLSTDTIRHYQNAGAMHILAISGLHIGILLMILNLALRPLTRIRKGKRIRLALLIICLWSFAYITGLSPSVIRSVGMFTALSFGLFTGRSSATANYLFIALFLSLIIKPLYVFDLGFQLSYSAVFSIIVIAPGLKSVWNPPNKISRYFWNLLVISLSAQIGILPMSLYYFNQFSAIFFLSSMFIVPFLGILLGAGYFMFVLDGLDMLGVMYVQVYAAMIEAMNTAVEFIGGLDIFVFKKVFFNETLLLVSYVLIIFLVYWMHHNGKKGSTALLSGVIVLFLVLLSEKRSAQKKSSLVVFDAYQQSLVLGRLGDRLSIVYNSLTTDDPKRNRLLQAYQLQHFKTELSEEIAAKNFFRAVGKKVMILDHSLIQTDFGFNPDILILINSPKINLDRMLREIQPETIVADGSNFRSYKSLWEKSARLFGIPFHDTSERGAFTLSKEGPLCYNFMYIWAFKGKTNKHEDYHSHGGDWIEIKASYADHPETAYPDCRKTHCPKTG